MAMYSVKTWVGISSYNSWFGFSAQNTIGDWDFHREAFIVRLSFTAHLRDISILSSCIGFKSRESPGHSKKDIPLISILCFANLG